MKTKGIASIRQLDPPGECGLCGVDLEDDPYEVTLADGTVHAICDCCGRNLTIWLEAEGSIEP